VTKTPFDEEMDRVDGAIDALPRVLATVKISEITVGGEIGHGDAELQRIRDELEHRVRVNVVKLQQTIAEKDVRIYGAKRPNDVTTIQDRDAKLVVVSEDHLRPEIGGTRYISYEIVLNIVGKTNSKIALERSCNVSS
jgi:hypothetical protein